nr:reverse transcriptase [Tanacetum cinerariifolium]
MVNTRNNNLVLNTPPSTDPIQAALTAIQETLATIQAEVRVHSTEIASLKRGEGTSQPRTDELSAQLRPHPEPNNTPYGKLIRIEFPKFSGDDVKDWVYRCKQFFKVDGVLDGRKIQLASMHTFDAALVWYQQYVKKYPDNTLWEHFEALLNKVDLPEPIAVSMFIGGLKPEVGTPMRIFQANTLSESYQLARMQEATNTILKPSTHNFLDIHTAKKLGCRLDNITPMQVSVANGQRMMSTSVCHDFKWSFQNEVFTSDVMLPLGGCEMVLGIQWLATLGDIQCNFKKLIMKFNHKGRQLVLTGITNTHVHWMGNEGLMKQAELSSMALCVLPPQRSHDHQIPFMPNTPSINVRPYKYPPNQKDAIEGMVKELMDSGVIRASQSPFSSPIVMVKKKDGTWRMCIVYRQLNKHTVKDKFPIPVIEELIDELNGSVVFSKLDLSKNLKEHCDHFAQVLQVMKDNTLYAKRTKCYFAVPQVEYLGHIISAQGVSTDPSKTEAMQKWPIPSTLKQLRGFLGLTGYYRSGKGIGAVLCQNGHPIAYWSKTLSAKHQTLSTYEKEFLAVVAALDKRKGYLLDRHFKIRTDHFSLKPKGSENVVADALSRIDSSGELLQIIVSSVSSGVWDKVKDSWKNDLDTQNLIKAKERRHFHDEAIGGHYGAHVTMKKLGSLFYWKGLKKMVKQMIRYCNVCQRQKPDLSAYPGLIQPLPIPERIWKEISMDFIKKLPTSHEKSVILVVLDRLSKYAHFIPLTHPFTASQVAQVFLDQVYKRHGLPESIVSDRDKVFLSSFWKALFAELKAREEAIKVLKFHLKRSQDRMRNQANKHTTDKQFEVGDWVYLKLQPRLTGKCPLGKANNTSFHQSTMVLSKLQKELEKLLTDWSCQVRVRSIRSSTFHSLRSVMAKTTLFLEDKESSRRMELIRTKSEVNTVGLKVNTARLKKLLLIAEVSTVLLDRLKKLVLLAEVSTASVLLRLCLDALRHPFLCGPRWRVDPSMDFIRWSLGSTVVRITEEYIYGQQQRVRLAHFLELMEMLNPYSRRKGRRSTPTLTLDEFEARSDWALKEMAQKDVGREQMYNKMNKFMKGFSQGGPTMFMTQEITSFFEGVQATPSYVLPKKLGDKSRNKGTNVNVSPFNLGNAIVDDNVDAEEVMITGVYLTDDHIVYENLDHSKCMQYLLDPNPVYLDCHLMDYSVPELFW